MGLTAATAAWLVPSLIAAGGATVSAIQTAQNASAQKKQAEEAKQTAIKQAQANAEKSPELTADVGQGDAIKKKRTSFGIQDTIIANNNLAPASTIGQKETWG